MKSIRSKLKRLEKHPLCQRNPVLAAWDRQISPEEADGRAVVGNFYPGLKKPRDRAQHLNPEDYRHRLNNHNNHNK